MFLFNFIFSYYTKKRITRISHIEFFIWWWSKPATVDWKPALTLTETWFDLSLFRLSSNLSVSSGPVTNAPTNKWGFGSGFSYAFQLHIIGGDGHELQKKNLFFNNIHWTVFFYLAISRGCLG